MYSQKKGCAYHIKWGLGLLLAAFACIGPFLIGADITCRINIENWTPYYPDAMVVSVEHDSVRARALGTTTIVLHTTDDAETVRQFFRDHTLAMLRAERSRGIATTEWRVEEQPDGNGSVIYLYSACGI